MTRLLIGGAGGAPSEGVIKSLQEGGEKFEVLGMGSDPTDLILSAAKRKILVPGADDPLYRDSLMKILETFSPDLAHFQNDLEVYTASLLRDDILNAGVSLFMPDHDVIDSCVHKYKSYSLFKEAGLAVPENRILRNSSDLRNAFRDLGDNEGRLWIRDGSIGGGGKGSIPTSDYELAKGWIDHFNGWGTFLAAEMLGRETVTWSSIWYEGDLVVAQARKRESWTHGNRTISGVTGVTKVGVTCSDPIVDKIALSAVKAVSSKPHGIFGVDMTYDRFGTPNPTEINVSRFFTTVLFFTKAGLNLPEIFADLALTGKKPELENKLNPLEPGLIWLRGMDREPRLARGSDFERELIYP